MVDMEKRLRAVNATLAFLNDNYPCDCGDSECPTNYFEAEELVSIVEKALSEV